MALDLWGQDPFDMHEAALELENLSYGLVAPPFLDVSWTHPQSLVVFQIFLALPAEGFAAAWWRRGQVCLASDSRERLGSCAALSVLVNRFGSKIPISLFLLKAPNQLRMKREKPSAEEEGRYLKARGQQALYKAAAQLWQKGVDMRTAIKIVSQAVHRASSV